MPNADLEMLVTDILARAPEWVRQGLLASDKYTRKSAEQTLAALIVAALSDKLSFVTKTPANMPGVFPPINR
jgi:hypothetical protein